MNTGKMQALTIPNDYWPGKSQCSCLGGGSRGGTGWRWDTKVRGSSQRWLPSDLTKMNVIFFFPETKLREPTPSPQ